jgi:hypothetical protein
MPVATIPAKDIVQVNPGVLPAGGSALDMIGLMLTNSSRPPLGQVLQFASAADVSTYFGPSATETTLAAIYFQGFDNSHKKPGSLLFTQYNQGSVDAFLRGASVAGLTLAQLQAVSGTLVVTVDGYPRSAAALNLSAASSFSAAAALIQTALNAGAANPNIMSCTASTAASTNSFTGSITGQLLTVTAISAGTIVAGTTISGTGVTASTKITGQISGTAGGVGLYTVDISQVVASTTISGTYGTMTVTAISLGTLSVGQALAGGTTPAGTQVTQQLTGTPGSTGTYAVSTNTVVVSGTITGAGAAVAVTYDSVSGGFLIASSVIVGSSSSIGYGSGTTADTLNLRAADGAVISQGSAGQTPSNFMNNLVAVTGDWACFMTMIDPDFGVGSVQKQAFAAWVNGTNGGYCYAAWDTDITPTITFPAPASLGGILQANNSSGTFLIWAPDNIQGPIKAALFLGTVAAIDFTQRNGRITIAFKSQTGIVADVTNQTVAHNLGGDPQSIGQFGNGYNFYGVYATRSQSFIGWNRGTISGPFDWADSYINQIWLNNALQQAIVELLFTAFSIPYNNTGYAMIEAACLDPIQAGVLFGAIRPGITLSNAQISQINNSAGVEVASTVSQRGWYLQIADAAPQVRAARASPPCTLWYTDGQSVQAITLASIEVQ